MKTYASIFITLIIVTNSMICIADEAPRAISISKDELSGKLLIGQPEREFLGNKAKFASVYKSQDGKFTIGLFSMTVEVEANGIKRYENFPKDEFMFFLEGTMKLIDDNGIITEAGPGEALLIPKGWSGKRITNSIRKISVVYKDNNKGD